MPATGFEGIKVSFLGDSITTFNGVSNDRTVNSTLAGAAYFYQSGYLGVYQQDTWWQQAIDELGMELLVNNSWSGSCLLAEQARAKGSYVSRCVQLHNSAGEEPDIIAIYMGTNDIWSFPDTLGSADEIAYDTLITKTDEGFRYQEPVTSCEAYAITLHKMQQRYPDAEIYCFTLLPSIKHEGANSEAYPKFNASIKQIAEHFGVYIVDLFEDTGIPLNSKFGFFIKDNSVHPGPNGMDAITGCFTSALIENSQYATSPSYDVSYKLVDVIVDQGTAKTVMGGRPFSCTFTELRERTLDVTVTMGGENITAECLNGNTVTIGAVTGDIQISARGDLPAKDPVIYRWDFLQIPPNSTYIPSVTQNGYASNKLFAKIGVCSYGYFTNAVHGCSKIVVLKYNRPWTLEWKSAILPSENTTGGFLLANHLSVSQSDCPYLFYRQNGEFIAFGVTSGGIRHHYGVSLSAHNIDVTQKHTYRIDNRLFEDGTNMFYLYVDNQELGPMNHHWLDTVDRMETVNWAQGRDFDFAYMGNATYLIDNTYIDYIHIWENGHTHSYTASITEPTCTKPGYTTYSCDCGCDYETDRVPATDNHNYDSGVCDGCGTVAPVLTLTAPTLEFQDMINIIAFFTAENTEDVVEMGMITYPTEVAQWNVESAHHVLPGAIYVESDGRYYATSQGIHAKQLADDVYLAIYAKLNNGSYVYSKLASYSATTYADYQLKNSDSISLKQLVVAMLNYGAEAQRYFGHNTDTPANAGMTEEQMAFPDSFRPDMIQAIPAVSEEKQGIFLNNGGFTRRRPAVSFEGAFCIHYFFTPAYVPVGEITLYHWTEADFLAADVLTAENASGSLVMTEDGNDEYHAEITGIAAKDLSNAVYVAASYSDGNSTWTSGALGYSIGAYCGSISSKGGAAAELAKAAAVYGYHAKKHFG